MGAKAGQEKVTSKEWSANGAARRISSSFERPGESKEERLDMDYKLAIEQSTWHQNAPEGDEKCPRTRSRLGDVFLSFLLLSGHFTHTKR